MSGDPVARMAVLFSLWALAVVGLVVALGYFWQSGGRFLLVLVGWVVLISPLMVATARWLAALERE